MAAKPNRTQTAVELAYDLTKNNITGGSLDGKLAVKWFPFIATLFFWIWFSNMLGYLPLPTNSEHTFDLFGVEVPSFAIYAATANISIPLALTLVVWFSYHFEGVRDKGFFGYLKSWLPGGIEDMNFAFKAFVFVIECISHFVRLISLSVRLFANILAGHLLLLFMGGGLAVLLGIASLGRDHLPGRVRLLRLRGRSGRDASGVHLRHPDLDLHRRRGRRKSLNHLERSCKWMSCP